MGEHRARSTATRREELDRSRGTHTRTSRGRIMGLGLAFGLRAPPNPSVWWATYLYMGHGSRIHLAGGRQLSSVGSRPLITVMLLSPIGEA